jgi:hypothetical protein
MGWNWSSLCGIFVITLCLVAILCDILKYNLIGVVLTYNFNFGK